MQSFTSLEKIAKTKHERLSARAYRFAYTSRNAHRASQVEGGSSYPAEEKPGCPTSLETTWPPSQLQL